MLLLILFCEKLWKISFDDFKVWCDVGFCF